MNGNRSEKMKSSSIEQIRDLKENENLTGTNRINYQRIIIKKNSKHGNMAKFLNETLWNFIVPNTLLPKLPKNFRKFCV